LNSEEGLNRYRIFKENLKYIEEHNNKNLSYKLGINQFADLTDEEFKRDYLLSREKFKSQKKAFLSEISFDFDKMATQIDMEMEYKNNYTETSFDFRDYFDSALSQRKCGSCWAFTAAATVEGNYNKKYKKNFYELLQLSPQQILDCDSKGDGCEGGYPNSSYKYLSEHSLATLDEYPYQAVKGICKQDKFKGLAKVKNYQYCTSDKDEGEELIPCNKNLYLSIFSKGPSALGMDSTSLKFRLYTSGIIKVDKHDCNYPNHAVTGVGYFNNSDGEGIIVRNTWGSWWGENGNFRIKYQPKIKETCFLTNSVYHPEVEEQLYTNDI
jgi:KDEL-tailed cysteine endopeptidase